jgi:hypothetical protein
MSCDEHLAAAKQAHEIAAMHDEQYQTAKSKKRALSNSPPSNPYFAHDQSSAKKFKAEMDTHKREAERHTDLAQQHEIAIGALSPQELYTCLLSDFETPQSEQNETL